MKLSEGSRPPTSADRTPRWEGPKTDGPPGQLRQATASAALWSFFGFAGQQALRALTAIVLARLIGPANYGVVAQALILMAFMSVLFGQGVGVTLIQALKLEERLVGTAVWMTAGVSGTLAALTVALAGPLSGFFHTPELRAVLEVLAISVLLEGLAVVPQNLLLRQLRMRLVAIREFGAALIGGAIGITAAIAGATYWALVIQILVTDAITLVMLMVMVGPIPIKPSWDSFTRIRGFSLRVLLAGILNFLMRNADNVIVGRVLGPVQLGFYALSYRTMLLVVQGLSFTTNRVTLPVFSQLQNHTARLRSMYFRVSELLAAVGFPVTALCAVAAPTGVPLVMGAAWKPAIPVIQILAVTGAQQSVISACTPAFLAKGRSDLVLRYQVLNAIVTVSAFLVGVQWGIVGVAAAYAIASTLLWPVAIAMLGSVLDFRLRDYVRVLVPSATSTACLVAGFIAVQESAVALSGTSWLGLVLGLIAGLAAFTATYLLAWRDDAERVLGVARDLVRARSAEASEAGATP